jgi:tRNA-specific 2-thiouridylase
LNKVLQTSQISWTFDGLPATKNYTAKTRYRQSDAPCQITQLSADTFTLEFDQAQWAVTPGQSAVLYDGERCLGGGIITS